MSVETRPRVLIVSHTVTRQSGRVAGAIAEELEGRGCEVTHAMVEFTDKRWAGHLSQFPIKRPMASIAAILPLAEKNGRRFTDKAHFVAAGGQVTSMLSWLGYMKHGEAQKRVTGLKMPAPNLKPNLEQQAKTLADGLVDRVLQPLASGTRA